jgi:hypothetical protein
MLRQVHLPDVRHRETLQWMWLQLWLCLLQEVVRAQ